LTVRAVGYGFSEAERGGLP